MRILILANNDIGLYRFRKELLIALSKEHEVFVSVPNGKFVPKIIEIGCSFIDTSISRHGTNPFQDIKLLKFYMKTIKHIKPDVVLTYTIKPNVYGGMACQKTKTPYLANITGLGNAIENKGLMQKLTLFLYKKGLKKANCVFFQNEANLEFMKKKKTFNSCYKLLPGSGVNLIDNPLEEYPASDEKVVFDLCRVENVVRE